MDRISYKKLKELLESDSLYCVSNFYISAFNGYYHILSENNKIVICEKTPGLVWENWNVFKAGYYFCKNGEVW